VKQSDKQRLENLPNKDTKYYQELEQKAKQRLPSDLWLPALPEVDQVITNRQERLESNVAKSGSHLFDL
jgi:hypothetical protein